eukprot:CAMPEP_0179013184 /NCGR_PEP_ID=MMETSP0796-20121207/1591_1 /TAXON_ID=73915 /ORGANISM="Pyrodinium bahamense, Strain pbaha01" /LENGTH=118 /DNA_ID=CAMNT_0020708671 /DNA_START=17 /DNA_END=373 /DNA_ORIENTATION=+
MTPSSHMHVNASDTVGRSGTTRFKAKEAATACSHHAALERPVLTRFMASGTNRPYTVSHRLQTSVDDPHAPQHTLQCSPPATTTARLDRAYVQALAPRLGVLSAMKATLATSSAVFVG